jgi:hypothetical protein
MAVASRVTLALVAALGGTALADDVFPRVPVTRASARAVRTLKAHPASSIDPRLPAIPFERFVVESVGADTQVSRKGGTCNIVLPRVLARERPLRGGERRLSARERRGLVAFVDVGTFSGLERPRLDSGRYWRETPEGRESIHLTDFWQLVVLREGPTWSVSDCDLKAEEDVCVMLEGRHRGGAWERVHVRTGTHEAPWSGGPVAMTNGLAVCGRATRGGVTLLEFPWVLRDPDWRRCEEPAP